MMRVVLAGKGAPTAQALRLGPWERGRSRSWGHVSGALAKGDPTPLTLGCRPFRCASTSIRAPPRLT